MRGDRGGDHATPLVERASPQPTLDRRRPRVREQDPLTFLDLWEGENPNNRTNWADPTYDKLIDDARNEADPDRRLAMLRQAEELFIREVPAFPIYFYVKTDLVKPWIKGYQPHLQGIHAARFFRVEL